MINVGGAVLASHIINHLKPVGHSKHMEGPFPVQGKLMSVVEWRYGDNNPVPRTSLEGYAQTGLELEGGSWQCRGIDVDTSLVFLHTLQVAEVEEEIS